MIAITERFPDEPDPEYPYAIGRNFLALDMPDEATIWFDQAIEIDPQHPVSRSIPLLVDYYWQRLDDDSFRLARELLDARIDDRAWARFIALLVLTDYGAATDRHEIVLDTLDNLYPHLFDEPPRDLDADYNGTFFAGLALLRSGDVERGRYLLNTADEMLAPSRSARGVQILDVVYALGDSDKTAARFAEYVRNRSSRYMLEKFHMERADYLDVLRDDPLFIDYLEGYRELAEEQRQLLQGMLKDPSGS
jgi:tetratricopeptide (TPR) repeat protein